MTDSDQSRRQFLQGSLAIGVMTTIAGCNTNAITDNSTQTPTSSTDQNGDKTKQPIGGWSAPDYDAARTGAAPSEKSITSKPSMKWEANLPNELGGTPVVANNTVYCITQRRSFGSQNEGSIFAIDARSGKRKWNKAIAGAFGSPVISGSTVYFSVSADENVAVYALDADSGDEKWTQSLTNHRHILMHPPVVKDGSVYIPVKEEYWQNDPNGGLKDPLFVSLDASDGSVNWYFREKQLDTNQSVEWNHPTVAHSRVFLTTVGAGSDGFPADLLALDASTGEIDWKLTGDSQNYHPYYYSPVAGPDHLFVANRNGLRALDPATGEEQWAFTQDPGSQKPAVTDDTVFLPTQDGYLYALDRTTGEKKWNYIGSQFTAQPVVTESTVYVRNRTTIHAINRSKPERQWKLDDVMGLNQGPTVADGHLFTQSGPGSPTSLAAFTESVESSSN
ncbi:Outer membrane protein assembly factor BamB, contains PQQ-like beta-propeller repeat [Halorientalis persicus]|uniref:Outer membrane protein assembly factor BamB, contains PQQ-like beta-propeller repeat n=1 Tax=Halorientalis persicus TaxID=1367881 RepID=A0A1H8VUW9_9EURY|nr:PQQ-binding-like beta-propeller repeat protein [Halorientalis persicus]SEP19100.1 Outer membrane protein assembly factor BamB, contains PQQ-like beta-propeller repeat [Halorientalis persicus]